MSKDTRLRPIPGSMNNDSLDSFGSYYFQDELETEAALEKAVDIAVFQNSVGLQFPRKALCVAVTEYDGPAEDVYTPGWNAKVNIFGYNQRTRLKIAAHDDFIDSDLEVPDFSKPFQQMTDSQKAAFNILNGDDKAYFSAAEVVDVPSPGDIIWIDFEDRENLRGGIYLKVHESLSLFPIVNILEGGFDTFENPNRSPSPPDVDPNVMFNLEGRIAPEEGLFISDPILSVPSRVLTEYEFWQGRRSKSYYPNGENDPVFAKLKTYWDNVRFGNNWQDLPWSAVYISYILRGEDFPARSSHQSYSREALNNGRGGGWGLYSLLRENVQLSVGDVLVKPRYLKGTTSSPRDSDEWWFSHGDVVWKIEGGIAYLAGGNLSSTSKINIQINLDANGIPDPKDYLVVLKKNAQRVGFV
jgi:hypothetical protein